MAKVKKYLLQPKEICEYCYSCSQNCMGKNPTRGNTYHCEVRRYLLKSHGFKISFGL